MAWLPKRNPTGTAPLAAKRALPSGCQAKVNARQIDTGRKGCSPAGRGGRGSLACCRANCVPPRSGQRRLSEKRATRAGGLPFEKSPMAGQFQRQPEQWRRAAHGACGRGLRS